jgi:hypothetical protein
MEALKMKLLMLQSSYSGMVCRRFASVWLFWTIELVQSYSQPWSADNLPAFGFILLLSLSEVIPRNNRFYS